VNLPHLSNASSTDEARALTAVLSDRDGAPAVRRRARPPRPRVGATRVRAGIARAARMAPWEAQQELSQTDKACIINSIGLYENRGCRLLATSTGAKLGTPDARDLQRSTIRARASHFTAPARRR